MNKKFKNASIENAVSRNDPKYIKHSGNTTWFVNGTGLDMAPYDVNSLNGPNPPNFLDLSSCIREDQVYEIFKLLVADPKVETILNIVLGGNVKYAVIAYGIIQDC